MSKVSSFRNLVIAIATLALAAIGVWAQPPDKKDPNDPTNNGRNVKKEVNVTIDSHPGKVFKGIVVQRSNISEFTPRNVQSVDERRHQVFGVKILVKDPGGVLNAGMAAEVTIPLD